MTQSAGEKETMDSHNLLSLSLVKSQSSFENFYDASLSLQPLALAFLDSIDLGREREIRAQRVLPDASSHFPLTLDVTLISSRNLSLYPHDFLSR